MQRRSFVKVEDGATKGATLGRNIYDSSGKLLDAEALVIEAIAAEITPTAPATAVSADTPVIPSSSPTQSTIQTAAKQTAKATTIFKEIVKSVTASPSVSAQTIWRNILEIPKNIKSLAALSGIGFASRVNGTTGAWVNRIIRGTPSRITVNNGDGVATPDYLELYDGTLLELNSGENVLLQESYGNPRIDLVPVPDSGIGTLKVFVRDAWGRVTGSREADSYDMPQFPVVKDVMDSDFTIREEHQLIVYDSFEINGELNIEGKLVIL